jgi:hypothetical protein
MSLFKKKEDVNSTIPAADNFRNFDYTKWNEDFGFIIMMMSNELSIQTKYVVDILVKQYSSANNGLGTVHDRDIEDIFSEMLRTIIGELSDNYVSFMTSKYFKSDTAFYNWIGTYLYGSLVETATKINTDQIKTTYASTSAQKIYAMNGIKISNLANEVKKVVDEKKPSK